MVRCVITLSVIYFYFLSVQTDLLQDRLDLHTVFPGFKEQATEDQPFTNGIDGRLAIISPLQGIYLPAGTVTYWVVQTNQVGDADQWDLQVRDFENILQSHTDITEGNGNKSRNYTFDWSPP
jgi:hypothetical protein